MCIKLEEVKNKKVVLHFTEFLPIGEFEEIRLFFSNWKIDLVSSIRKKEERITKRMVEEGLHSNVKDEVCLLFIDEVDGIEHGTILPISDSNFAVLVVEKTKALSFLEDNYEKLFNEPSNLEKKVA